MKKSKKSLTKELLMLCILAFGIAFLFYQVTTAFGIHRISERYNTEHHIEVLEKKYAKELQVYVDENKVTLKDLEKIDAWALEQTDVYLKLFYKGNLFYDTLYGAMRYEKLPKEEAGLYEEMKFYRIQLQDGTVEALLFGYDYRVESYVRFAILIVSFLLFFVVFILGIRKKISYLVTISEQVDRVTENLEHEVSVQGEDEIANVAQKINDLRASVIEKMEREKEAYDANMHLVTTLSHDIKTPLTSVIAYLELAREKLKGEEEISRYLMIAFDKAMHLKKQTNDLFEHFLLHSNTMKIAFEEVNGNELIVQMLEENLFDLEAKGVVVNRKISDITSTLHVNVHLIYRVFENLFSNINKYADFTKEIEVEYYLKEEKLIVSVKNKKKQERNVSCPSTKIGLNNCKAIMEKHGGRLEIEETEESFRITLYFPVNFLPKLA